MFRALPSRQDLARIDPFTLGEAVASQLRSLDDLEVRAFAHTCATRFDGYYRSEIKRALAENPSNGTLLRDAMIAFFSENPRAIERCDGPFVAATLRAMGTTPEYSLELEPEEPSRRKPMLLAAAIGLILLGAGAAIDRLAFAMHQSSSTSSEPIVIFVTPAPSARAAAPKPQLHTSRPPAKPHVVAARPAPVYVTARPHRYYAPHVSYAPAHKAVTAPHRQAAPKHIVTTPKHVASASATPAVNTPLRISHWGRYHGPLIRVAVIPSATPSATPRKRSWLQRQLDHLNPFKHHPDVQYPTKKK